MEAKLQSWLIKASGIIVGTLNFKAISKTKLSVTKRDVFRSAIKNGDKREHNSTNKPFKIRKNISQKEKENGHIKRAGIEKAIGHLK